MPGGTSRRIYSPMTQNEVIDVLRDGYMPAPFVRRMRVINLLTASTLQKLEQDLLAPWTVLNINTALNDQTSQDYIITTIRNEPLQYALWHGNVRSLWNISDRYPMLRKGFYTGWIQRFFWTPFDPVCMLLAMRAKALLDILDEMGHSYNLMRMLGFGFIDLGEIPGEEPGDPGDYYPPEIDNPIEYPDAPVDPAPDPEPGEPGYSTPDPEIMPGETGYTEPGPGETGYVKSVPIPGDYNYVRPSIGDVDYHDPPGGSGGRSGNIGSGINIGDPWNVSKAPGSFGGPARLSSLGVFLTGDPCEDKDDPEETVSFSYTTQQMQVNETQDFAVTGNDPKWSGVFYTWKISSGGGSLSADFGLTVTYTAPADNPECANNPTIELWCGGEIMASLEIAVNAGSGDAYVTNFSSCESGEAECGAGWDCACYCYEWDEYNCDGTFASHHDNDEENYYERGCTGVKDEGICFAGTACTPEEGLGPVDLRSPAQKTAGCCPEELL